MDNTASVAIVDDETQLVRTYELLFKKRRIPMAFTAYDGDEAIEKFRKRRPQAPHSHYRLPPAVDERHRSHEGHTGNRAPHEDRLHQRRRK